MVGKNLELICSGKIGRNCEDNLDYGQIVRRKPGGLSEVNVGAWERASAVCKRHRRLGCVHWRACGDRSQDGVDLTKRAA